MDSAHTPDISRAAILCPPGEWWYRHLHKALSHSIPTTLFPIALGSQQGYRWEDDLDPLLGAAPAETLFLGSPAALYAGIPRLACRTAVWLDFFPDHPELAAPALLFDHVFVTSADGVAMLRDAGCRSVSWLPYAFDDSIQPNHTAERVHDVAFVGATHLPLHEPRRRLLDALRQRYSMNDFERPVWMDDLYKTYASAKIVVNVPTLGGFNMRTFEAMGCGALLVTEDVRQGQEQLFQAGRHCVTYGSRDELFEKIDYFLAHPQEREEIAREGQQEVLNKHTYRHRAESVLSEMNAHGTERRRTEDVDRICHAYAVFYHRHHRPDLLLRLARRSRLSMTGRARVVGRLARSMVAEARKPSPV
jgi:hypothetical protein